MSTCSLTTGLGTRRASWSPAARRHSRSWTAKPSREVRRVHQARARRPSCCILTACGCAHQTLQLSLYGLARWSTAPPTATRPSACQPASSSVCTRQLVGLLALRLPTTSTAAKFAAQEPWPQKQPTTLFAARRTAPLPRQRLARQRSSVLVVIDVDSRLWRRKIFSEDSHLLRRHASATTPFFDQTRPPDLIRRHIDNVCMCIQCASTVAGPPPGSFLPSLSCIGINYSLMRAAPQSKPPLETRSRYTLLGGAGVDGGIQARLACRWRTQWPASSEQIRDMDAVSGRARSQS